MSEYAPTLWAQVREGDKVYVPGRCGGRPHTFGPYTVLKKYILRNERIKSDFSNYQENLLRRLE